MASQLWELLIKVENDTSSDTLTCGECFAVIELLVEGIELGVSQERLARLARNHLARCPDCQEQIGERLSELEEMGD